MHKNFANTLFLGKRVFFLPECHSTNVLLMEMIRKNESVEGDILRTDFQTAGRGQRGRSWLSEPAQNLLFSIHLSPSFIPAERYFLLNMLTSVAIHKTLSAILPGQVSIKWPNDIYTNDKKICGILIQTILEGNRIKNAAIGIGLNVNQLSFGNLKATSLSLETARNFEPETVLEFLIRNLEAGYLDLKSGNGDALIRTYHESLYRRGEIHWFRDPNGPFEGEIIGVDQSGRLNIRVKQSLKSFDLKEVEFL